MTTKHESPLERIRRVRQEISEEFGHDPHRLVAHYMELQKQYSDRLVHAPEPGPGGEAAA